MTGSLTPRLALAGLLVLGAALPAATLSSAAQARPQEKAAPAKAKSKSNERTEFSATEAESAAPHGLPGRLRIAGDDASAFEDLIDDTSASGDPWLVLSGGGDNGAFAAGLLAGWSKAGDRPAFGVITGVSTGALIAPFAFVGSKADEALKQNYTEISAADVFEFGGNDVAMTDNWPLKERIEKWVTPDLLKAVAAEHAKGRRLFVATTMVDSERSQVWDMGAIASLATGPDSAKHGSKPLALFREIVLASTAIPGVFPPVMINAVGKDGRTFQEMQADGGIMGQFFLAPPEVIAGRATAALPARTVYLVVNNRLAPEFGVTPRTTLTVLGKSMSAAIKAQTQASLALARAYAARTGLDLRIAEIDGRFTAESQAPFERKYMKALFAHGEALGRDGTAFGSTSSSKSWTIRGARLDPH